MRERQRLADLPSSVRNFVEPEEKDFCGILIGRKDAIRVGGTNGSAAFMSKGSGHVLVAPLHHVVGHEIDKMSFLAEMAMWEGVALMRHVVLEAYSELHGADGMRIVLNLGERQDVRHLHAHLIPTIGPRESAREIQLTKRRDKIVVATNIRRRFRDTAYLRALGSS